MLQVQVSLEEMVNQIQYLVHLSLMVAVEAEVHTDLQDLQEDLADLAVVDQEHHQDQVYLELQEQTALAEAAEAQEEFRVFQVVDQEQQVEMEELF